VQAATTSRTVVSGVPLPPTARTNTEWRMNIIIPAVGRDHLLLLLLLQVASFHAVFLGLIRLAATSFLSAISFANSPSL